MDNVTIIRLLAGLAFFAVAISFGIFYLLTLSGALKKCSPQSRTMEPGMVWLLLIPLVSMIWQFFVVNALAKSLGNEFRLRNMNGEDAEPGKSVGMGLAICGVCSIIPIVNFVAGPLAFVLWIVYWVRIAGYSRKLDAFPAMLPSPAAGA